jgi:hypothetical protein
MDGAPEQQDERRTRTSLKVGMEAAWAKASGQR